MRISPRTAGLLIAEAYVHDLTPARAATYFRLANPGPAPVALTGWRLVVDGRPLRFPAGAGLSPGATLYVARSAGEFQRLMGFYPEWQYAAADTRAPQLEAPDGVPEVNPWAGAAVLETPDGRAVDALAWGSVPAAVPGWTGPPLPSAPPGEVYLRARDEPSRRLVDTGSRADWKQGREWLPLRSYMVGQTNLPPAAPVAVSGRVTCSVAPDCTMAALVPPLAGARRSIDVNLYQMTSTPAAELLMAAVRRGVRVRVLMDGTPFGRVLDKTRYLAREMAERGVTVRWMIYDNKKGVSKRYRYNHAKYAVVDGEHVLLWSENWSAHSFPEQPAGGNRGWGIAVQSRPLAQYFTQVFAADFDPGRPDSVPLLPGHPQWGGVDRVSDPGSRDPDYGYKQRFAPLTVTEKCRITPVLAPDHALMETAGVIGLMRRAERSLEVECQYVPLHWGMPEHGSPEDTPNLYLAEVVAAARRGVQVRVLVGHRDPEPWFPQDTVHTVAYLNTIAAREKLALEARFEDTRRTGLTIHNKGLIADGRRVLVTSVNWSENAPGHNREAGLLVESPAVAGYYRQVFDWDWEQAQK